MKTLMIQGTTSDAGKSTLVAALCRVFANQGIKVAPFKPQNMALNSAVTNDGGEIGRAQALQAIAAKVEPETDFNPILLKPNSDTGAQVIIHGKAISNMEAGKYHDYKKVAMDAVITSHERLAKRFDLLLVEGAGSPAEINLRENDIANMGYAEKVDCPVIIIADIDKGGVFAHLVGTLALLSGSEQARVKGFVINRFRGDISLLQGGLDWLEQYTGKPVLGVLPYLHDLTLDAEDAVAINNNVTHATINIAILLVPHISNHTDFDALRLHPNINVNYIRHTQVIPDVDLIILPGSKNVLGDLTFLINEGWDNQIKRHLRYGGKVLGICGGMQMLGNIIYDPEGVESSLKSVSGLALCDFETTLTSQKVLSKVTATLKLNNRQTLCSGYEIHAGVSKGNALKTPLITFSQHPNGFKTDGFISDDNAIAGTYLHGLFDEPNATMEILKWVKPDLNIDPISIDTHREQQLARLATMCETHLDIAQITSIYKGHNND
ncbi:cobyric acid synthase [Pseudoalteromonas marina]|uniref:Cobyric acid synthase n=1 Tax=Pseudoalteromonas marina TaxID=267375 RepID=A0ABT9FEK8_9GAMM|nr:cobyric acid synthase [Pseudoalteromonas marina]EAW27486.1 cobyric acid synthase [Alteromonadales bacterium TW-7]MDP2486205.1 cobyric acid synthase [Pseudoalteromonas marina]MDP2565230.1 cobyric acid synthase [Pseudoalteromonas marina]|tara:strand:+ start:2528 stop:4009 length:1482 start_codon:yes stop_codon:yes gene_type:complete